MLKFEARGQIIEVETYRDMIAYMEKHKIGCVAVKEIDGEKTVIVGAPKERPIVDLSNSPIKEEGPRAVRRGR